MRGPRPASGVGEAIQEESLESLVEIDEVYAIRCAHTPFPCA